MFGIQNVHFVDSGINVLEKEELRSGCDFYYNWNFNVNFRHFELLWVDCFLFVGGRGGGIVLCNNHSVHLQLVFTLHDWETESQRHYESLSNSSKWGTKITKGIREQLVNQHHGIALQIVIPNEFPPSSYFIVRRPNNTDIKICCFVL